MDHLTAMKIELLEDAYKKLEGCNFTDVHVGICWALWASAQHKRDKNLLEAFDPVRKARIQLELYIGWTLGEASFYYGWLASQHGIHGGYVEIRRGRLAWIDAMIAALEKGESLPEKPSLPSDYKGEGE